MSYSTTSAGLAYLVAACLALMVTQAKFTQPQPCDVTINKRPYRVDKRLYTHKQYVVRYGLPYEASNPPILYWIDVDCQSSNKLRAGLSFDFKDMPVEVNAISCGKNINFLNMLESSSEPLSSNGLKKSYLTFLIDFRQVFTYLFRTTL